MLSICKKSKLKKYTTRPGPPFPTQECKGQSKKGNNGKEYKSVANTRGVYKWVNV
jgi:hypothetical protein